MPDVRIYKLYFLNFIVLVSCTYMFILMGCFSILRVGVEGRDAVIDVLIKVIPKNKLAVELFVKVGGTCMYTNVQRIFISCNDKSNSWLSLITVCGW